MLLEITIKKILIKKNQMKNTIIVPVAHVVELGKATNLTLGSAGPRAETPNRPNTAWNR